VDRYTYELNKKGIKKQNNNYYVREELELMTTYQLREICRKEKIVNGLIDPLDKEDLIRQIMRFRGRENYLLITKEVEDGLERLETFLENVRLNFIDNSLEGCAKITAYKGLAIEYFDSFTIGYDEMIANTNALLVSEGEVCAIINLKYYKEDPKHLYITKAKELDCKEAKIKNYTLFCFGKKQSDLIYKLYNGENTYEPEHLMVYSVPVLNFEVRELLTPNMPLAIDFGTSNTTAGMYLDHWYFEQLGGDPIADTLKQNEINYVKFLDDENHETPVFPTVVGVKGVEESNINYVYGYEANRLFKLSYIDEGFCVFYDIKRWVSDPERLEEIVDREGRRRFIERKEIIKAYLLYIIESAKQRFKCNIKTLHISSPVKQKPLFIRLFREILADYTLEGEGLDEGVAVLYNSISKLIENDRYKNGQKYKALVIDCGGGTTDLSSCTFSIDNQRVAYKIHIQTAYENGDTDFGGNNLTYRIMQLLKISMARQLSKKEFPLTEAIIKEFDTDIFRTVDQEGIEFVYKTLGEAYIQAESIIPTKFKDYEHNNRGDYYKVKNNFYSLFEMAERIKKAFYSQTGVLRIAVSTIPINEIATTCLLTERWKLSIKEKNSLTLLKDIPTTYISIYDLNLLLKGDIYNIVKKFLEDTYKKRKLQEYAIIRLTGQSCKIDIFREALKEFIPGKIIEGVRREKSLSTSSELKLICLNGAIQYLKDKKFGYANIKIDQELAAFPYIITAYTHTGEEKTLIHPLDREKTRGFISRNMENLTLKLFLKDTNQKERYSYHYTCDPTLFEEVVYETIEEKYSFKIPQDDVDDIVDHEVKFFVYADDGKWGFYVVPILRWQGQLKLGPEQFFMFENEGWVTNFFDGTK